MIARYSRPRMSAIWAPETRFRIWFEIEAHALDAMAELGIVPKEAAAAVWESGRSRTSTRAWKHMWRKRWASRSSRSRPR